MTTKTTQELREAIKNSLGLMGEDDNGWDLSANDLFLDEVMRIIAKHEAELVENIVDKFITAILEALDETNGEFINYDKLLAEKFAKVADELTALTEKESKE